VHLLITRNVVLDFNYKGPGFVRVAKEPGPFESVKLAKRQLTWVDDNSQEVPSVSDEELIPYGNEEDDEEAGDEEEEVEYESTHMTTAPFSSYDSNGYSPYEETIECNSSEVGCFTHFTPISTFLAL